MIEEEVDLAELLEEVRRIEVSSKRLVTDVMAGSYASVFRGSGVEFSEVREYVEGDDPRRVDWSVTARMGRPFVKMYVADRQLSAVFLLDLSASMRGGFSRWSLRRVAAQVLACLGLAALRNDDRVGLIGFSEGVDLWLPPKRGLQHLLLCVRNALATRSTGRASQPAAALDLAGRVLPRHTLVFLVSDFMTRGYEGSLARCALRHDLVAVRITPPELDAPAAHRLRLFDPESGRETIIDFADERARRRYAESVARWRTDTEEHLQQAGVDLIDIDLPREPRQDFVSAPLRHFFRMREERGAKR